jgi:glycosyltransferase involved in cell wall biosynthesis
MKISIITVCYNSANTIESTFRSVESQIFADLEYIVIDGGSNDATLMIVNKYRHIITKLISEPDRGLYDAMNKGIKLATGDILGILNSDDIFKDDYVLHNIAEFHIENSIDASIGDIIQSNNFGRIVRKYSAKNWSPNKLRIGFMPAHPAIFFKRTLFDKFGNYNLDFTVGADYELVIRFFLCNNISWKYSNITTTSMLIGGISSSGYKSYNRISIEIKKALELNQISFSYFLIIIRIIWKLEGFLNKKLKKKKK